VKKIFVALLLTFLSVASVHAEDSVTVYLAFVFYSDKGTQRTIIVGGASAAECQEVFKAFLAGVDGSQVQTDFSVAACKPYSLSDLPKS
jgi:hypothetical protein